MAKYKEILKDEPISFQGNLGDGKTILATESSLTGSLRITNKILTRSRGDRKGVIVITRSLLLYPRS